MGQRLAVVGFIVALVVAIFAFTQQQAAVEEAKAAQGARAEAQEQQSIAMAQIEESANQQQQAENSAATLMVNAQKAATAQANAEADRSTALAQIDEASTETAKLQATSAAQRTNMEATGQAGQDAIAAAQTANANVLATAQAQIDAQATTQTSFDSALLTATAQVDLAEFARQSAEDDRAEALTQAWAASTALAASSQQLETAQAIISGVTPSTTPQPATATLIPEATETVESQATSVPQGTPSFDLTQQFTSKDGLVGFRYPESWSVAELDNGLIVVGSNEAVLQRSALAVPEGQVEIQMLVSPSSGFRGLQSGATPQDVMEVFYNVLIQQGGTADLANSKDVTIGSFPGAQLEGTDGTNDVIIIVVQIAPDVYAVTFTSAAKDGLPPYTTVVNKVLGTLSFKVT